MHTKDILAAELRKADLTAMADQAATGYYHDFLSPLATPCRTLVEDLIRFADSPDWPKQDEARALSVRAVVGEFDASLDETVAWAPSIGIMPPDDQAHSLDAALKE